tara:strand:- start:308 stop:565 length:258 start_codon:yes stop_codon:yes gene_type:complete
MTLKRRIAAIERDRTPTMEELSVSFERFLKDIKCPLPDATTAEEMQKAKSMLLEAKRGIQQGDEMPLCRFRDFATSLHAKYGANK